MTLLENGLYSKRMKGCVGYIRKEKYSKAQNRVNQALGLHIAFKLISVKLIYIALTFTLLYLQVNDQVDFI